MSHNLKSLSNGPLVSVFMGTLIGFIGLIFSSCNLAQSPKEVQTVSFNSLYDSLSKYDSTVIVFKTDQGTLIDTIFHGPILSRAGFQNLVVDGWDGGKAVFFITSYDGGSIVSVIVKYYDGVTQKTDSTIVIVKPGSYITSTSGILKVKILGDSTVFAFKSFVVKATATDADGVVTKYIWATDSKNYDTTLNPSKTYQWNVSDTGRHWVSVASVDNKARISLPETVFVRVKSGRPVIEIQKISDLGVGDTLVVKPLITDPNDDKFFIVWSKDGGALDTVPTPNIRIPMSPKDTGSHTLRAQALDTSGLLSDPYTVHFKVRALAPIVHASVHDTLVNSGSSVVINVMAKDTNGTVDSLIAVYGKGFRFAQTPSPFIIPWSADNPDSLWVRFQAKDNHGFLSTFDSTLIHYKPIHQEVNVYRYGFNGTLPGANGVEVDDSPKAVYLTNDVMTKLSFVGYREASGADFIFEANATFDSALITPINGASLISLQDPKTVISGADIMIAVGQLNKTAVAAGGIGSYVFHNGSSIRFNGTEGFTRARAGMAFYVATAKGRVAKVRILTVTPGDASFHIDTEYY